MESSALELTVERLADEISKIRDDIGGDGGLRERIGKIEVGQTSHESADEVRHVEVRGCFGDVKTDIAGIRTDVLALRQLVEQDARRPGVGTILAGALHDAVKNGTVKWTVLAVVALAGGSTGIVTAMGGPAAVMQAVGLGGEPPASLPPTATVPDPVAGQPAP